MKIRIILLTVLLILLIIVTQIRVQSPQTMLRKEFERYARRKFRNANIQELELSLLSSAVSIRTIPMFEEEMPTWFGLITDLYADHSLAKFDHAIYASELLCEKLKSSDKKEFLTSIYLSYFKPDTHESRCIEQYAYEQSNEEIKRVLLLISNEISERFYKMQYGLFKYLGLFVGLPQLSYLESPPKSDTYMIIYISQKGILAFEDALITTEKLPLMIERKIKSEKYHNFCIFFHADRSVKWELIWQVLEPLIELSEKLPENIEFFFSAEKRYDVKYTIEPNKFGIKFEIKKEPLKNIDIDIRIDQKGNISVNGKKKTLTELENLPFNKNIRFTFNKLLKLKYVLTTLSLIKKSNPSDYYYMVE